MRNNALTALTSIVSAALFVWGVGAWHVIAGLIISKLYQVSFMASLNARRLLAQELRAGAHRATGFPASPSPSHPFQVNVVSQSNSMGGGGAASGRPSLHRGKSGDHLVLPSLFGSHHSHMSRQRSQVGIESMPIQVTVEQTSETMLVE